MLTTCLSRPALPPSLHKKYVGPVKDLILSGLQRPNEGQTLSLIFQGLANLAKFEGWSAVQQSELAMDLLEMTSEVPKDSQHAALNAISRLLSVPTEGLDVYDLLISVHATFGGRGSKLDADLKALVSAIYGHLGTVERNVSDSAVHHATISHPADDKLQPVISRVSTLRSLSHTVLTLDTGLSSSHQPRNLGIHSQNRSPLSSRRSPRQIRRRLPSPHQLARHQESHCCTITRPPRDRRASTRSRSHDQSWNPATFWHSGPHTRSPIAHLQRIAVRSGPKGWTSRSNTGSCGDTVPGECAAYQSTMVAAVLGRRGGSHGGGYKRRRGIGRVERPGRGHRCCNGIASLH